MHPGGNDILSKKNGQDCTLDIEFHRNPKKIIKSLDKYFFGYLYTKNNRNNSCIIS